MPKLEDLKKTKIQEMIRAYNDKFQIKGWSKLKKAELISKLRNHPKLTITENSSGVKIKVKKDDERKLVRVGGRLIPQRKKKEQAEETQAEETKAKKKSNIPKITITEAEEPKGGGRADPKSKLGPIPKSNVKIRIVPKKKTQAKQTQAKQTQSVEEQVTRALAESDKKIEKENKKPKPPADEVERIPEMMKKIKEGKKKGKPLKGLELQIKELNEKYDLSDIKAPVSTKSLKEKNKKGKQKAKKQYDTDTDTDDDEPAPRMTPKQKKIQSLQREIGGLKRQIKNLKEENKSTKFSEGQLKKKQAQLKSLQ